MSKKILSAWVGHDLKRLDKEISRILENDGSSLSKLSLEVLKAGGKRLRPALVFICSRVGEYDFNQSKKTAMSVELIHMASLIHDDVLDRSELRRGTPTIYKVYGWKKAVAAGDYLFSLAFNILGSTGNTRIIEILARNAVDLSIGELEQMEGIASINTEADHYLGRIWKKTASLFSSSCQAGAILGQGNEEEIANLGEYGKNLGFAFQIYDDVLDIIGEEKITGKKPGIDIMESNFTLPVIYALDESKDKQELYEITSLGNKGPSEVNRALEIITNSDAIYRAKNTAREYINKALSNLDSINDKEVKKNLTNIGNYVIERYH